MKKLYLIACMALAVMTASAQQSVNLSTYNGTNVARYSGQECKVNVNRYVFTGWNTIALPFDVSESELNEIFGSDCRLEKLVGAEKGSAGIRLDFQDCKAEGIQANVPYLLYYSGEDSNKRINKVATLTSGQAALSFGVRGSNMTVSMEAAQTHIPGVGFYGVLAADNAEANFVKVDETKNGFYATRCYVKLSSGNDVNLRTNHLVAGEATSINAIVSAGERVDVYTLSGVKVASQADAAALRNIQSGVYVINGQKVIVK